MKQNMYLLLFLCTLIYGSNAIGYSKSELSSYLKGLYNTPGFPLNYDKQVPKDLVGIIENNQDKEDFRFKSVESESESESESERLMNQKINREGWLTVASKEFKNAIRFPEIPLPDGNKSKLLLTEKNELINEFYNKKAKKGGPTNLYFYFRLSEKHLYYSSDKKNINILGNILIKKIRGIQNLNDKNNCMIVTDFENIKYKLCSKTRKEILQWICYIQASLQLKSSGYCKDPKNFNAALLGQRKIIKRIITQPFIIIPMAQRHCNSKWNYLKKGRDWECLCKEGKEQSPIDLPTVTDSIASPAKPLFEYIKVNHLLTESRHDGLAKEGQNLRIQHYQHTLNIFHTNFGRLVTMDGAIYQAERIVFHTPSEHTIKGNHYPLEMQIIHKAQTKGDYGKHAVLSFLFKPKAGIYNKFIDQIEFFNLPNPVDKFRDILNNIFIPNVLLNSNEEEIDIMQPFSFYTYQGSVTAPPCVQNTIHFIASNPIPLSITALDLFKEALRMPDMEDSKGNIMLAKNQYLKNHRGTQSLNGRAIFHYDHSKYNCPTFKKKIGGGEGAFAGNGHYEKRTKTLTNYIFVEGNKPSGIPNAFVVDAKEARGK